MTAQNLSSDQGNLTDADDALKRQQLSAEFPKGIAPYTKNNLIGFGLFGGILAAGIAGAVNLRRANQSRAIPALLLISVVVLFVYEILSNLLLDRLLTNNLSNNFQLISNTINLVVGLGFSYWIATHQRPIIDRWFELAGKSKLRDQGGCLTALGWIVLSWIISVALILGTNTAIGQATLQITYPAKVYSAQGVSVTLPTGWEQTSPDLFNLKCDGSEGVCLALGQDGWSGSTALIRIFPAEGETTQQFASDVITGLQNEKATLTQATPQSYTSTALTNHDAYTIDGTSNGIQFVFTIVGDGSNVVGFLLNCTDSLSVQCSSLRDQIASTFVFAPDAGTAVTPATTPAAVSSRQ